MHQEYLLPGALRACSILKVSLEGLTKKSVTDAWKREIVKRVFPEITDNAVKLNRAKDILLRWLDEREGETGVFARREPRDGSGGDALLPPMEG